MNRSYVLIFCAFIIVAGLIGMYLNIAGAGWALAIGLIGGVCYDEEKQELPNEQLARAWRDGFEACEDGFDKMDNPHV